MWCHMSQNVLYFNSYVTSDRTRDRMHFFWTFQYIWTTVYMYSPTYMVMNVKLISYKVQVYLYKRELFIYDGLHCTLLPSSPSSSSSSSSLGASLSLSCSPFSLRLYRVQVIQRNIYQFMIIIDVDHKMFS